MLNQIHIKNYTIIDELTIDFNSGMTVITGETGAGKSVIFDTLELALGIRADSKVIRAGCDRCEITAVFDTKDIPAAEQWLQNNELDSHNECIIRRILSKDGRSRSTINGTPCQQQMTRELGSILLNIHGQNEQQILLKRNHQLELLDIFANHKQLTNEVFDLFNQWRKKNTELYELQELVNDKNNNKELLAYQLAELNELALQENEAEQLHQEYKQLANMEQILQNCNAALDAIGQNSLITAQKHIAQVSSANKRLALVDELLANAIIQADEANSELQSFLNNFDADPNHIKKIEQRLNAIYNVARKHKTQPEHLYDIHKQLTSTLEKINYAEEQFTAIQHALSSLASDYKKAAEKLTVSRRQAAEKLSAQISLYSQQLNMPHSRFNINFIENNEHKFSAIGLDQIEFMIATNPGQPLYPLNKIVSGGELSRISLAIETATAQYYSTPTLIFDEIDTGIGGKTAEIVGQLLKKLSGKTQVICVTHLPQIAAQGDNHLLVDKISTSQETFAQIKQLSGEERIAEIARMLGGINITKQTLAHAREMTPNA